MKILWTQDADLDLDEQIEYIALSNPLAAVEQRDFVIDRVEGLTDFPNQGRKGRKPNTRELVITNTPFIVVYRVRPRKFLIEIIRVIHGSQQWP